MINPASKAVQLLREQEEDLCRRLLQIRKALTVLDQGSSNNSSAQPRCRAELLRDYLLTAYNDAAWARWTYEVLQHGVAHHSGAGFIAWPDTGRAWSDHLTAEQVTFLNQFLPPVEPG